MSELIEQADWKPVAHAQQPCDVGGCVRLADEILHIESRVYADEDANWSLEFRVCRPCYDVLFGDVLQGLSLGENPTV